MPLQVNQLTRGMDSTAKAKQELADLKNSQSSNPATIGRVNVLQKTNNELNKQNNMLMDEIVELKRDLVVTSRALELLNLIILIGSFHHNLDLSQSHSELVFSLLFYINNITVLFS